MEFLYIISNPSMPGMVKVGRTSTSPEQRLKELNTTGVPTAFEIEVVFSVTNSLQAEKRAHQALKKHRANARREFFKVSPKVAANKIIKSVSGLSVYQAKEGLNVEQVIAFHEQKKKEEDEAQQKRIKEYSEQRAKQKRSLLNQLDQLQLKRAELGPMPDFKRPWWELLLLPFHLIYGLRIYMFLSIPFLIWISIGSEKLSIFFVALATLAIVIGTNVIVEKYEAMIKEKRFLLQQDHLKLDCQIGDVRRELRDMGHKF